MSGRKLVLGTGMTGQSVMRYLHKSGQAFDVFDTRKKPPALSSLRASYPHSHFYLVEVSAIDWARYDNIIVSPGVKPTTAIIAEGAKHGVFAIGDLELFALTQPSKPIIAITGTNGKSTVTSLVGHILQQAQLKVAVVGNIGQPILDVLEQEVDVWVLELSSFQLYYQQSFAPSIACILNISEDHLDWHGSLAAYQQAKHKIYLNADTIVYNADDAATRPQNMSRAISFSMTDSKGAAFYFHQDTFYQAGKTLFDCAAVNLTGMHNYQNILAALAIVEQFGIEPAITLQALSNFQGLEHRSQHIREKDGVHWFNDSKGTNVGAAIAALNGLGQAFSGKIVWIGGGEGKGADFSPLAQTISNYGRGAILMGTDKERISAVLPKHIPQYFVQSMAEAVQVAQQQAQEGDCVLLSPACASFDMFKNYMLRGQIFTQLVQGL